ncbi:MAG: DUF2948 family protein [Pseudomonadota bacterium]
MTEHEQPAGDARFEDAPISDQPLRLKAEAADDLSVISALVQDSVARAEDVMFLPRKRRVVILLNRFRWEDSEAARLAGRAFERVRSALQIDDVRGMRARGIGRPDRDTVVSLLSLSFEPSEATAPESDGDVTEAASAGDTDDGRKVPAVPGALIVTCAGDAAFRIEVECLSATLADLTRPWVANAGLPGHEAD